MGVRLLITDGFEETVQPSASDVLKGFGQPRAIVAMEP